MMIARIRVKPLFVSIAAALAAGALGSALGGSAMGYGKLALPSFAPPPSVFPIVWTILYVLMGVAAYEVYEAKDSHRRDALTVYGISLVVNAFWPLFFFRFQIRLFAFFWLLLLLVLVLVTFRLFRKIRPLAGTLLIPYILWLVFAGVLNFSVYLMNR